MVRETSLAYHLINRLPLRSEHVPSGECWTKVIIECRAPCLIAIGRYSLECW
jgi:hypothetical protein